MPDAKKLGGKWICDNKAREERALTKESRSGTEENHDRRLGNIKGGMCPVIFVVILGMLFNLYKMTTLKKAMQNQKELVKGL